MNFDQKSISEQKKNADGGGGGEEVEGTLKPNSMPECQERYNTKQQPSTQHNEKHVVQSTLQNYVNKL